MIRNGLFRATSTMLCRHGNGGQWNRLFSRALSTHEPASQLEFNFNALKLSDFITDLCNVSILNEQNKIVRPEIMKAEKQSSLSYLSSLQLLHNTKMSPILEKQFEEAVRNMSVGRLIHLLSTMAEKNIKHEKLLQLIVKQLIDQRLPNDSYYLSLVIDAISRLMYLNKHLITKLKKDFLNMLGEGKYVKFDDFSSTLIAFGRLHLSDQLFWQKAIHWIEPKLSKFPKDSLEKCLWALSIANVDRHLTKGICAEFARRIDRKTLTPRNWLTHIHMFAVLGALTPSLAGTILNKEFFTALKKQQKREKLKLKMTDRIEQNLTYDAIRLNNIANCSRLELANNNTDKLINKKLDLEKVRRFICHGTVEQSMLTDFGLMLRLVVPFKSHSIGPKYHQETGAILEGRCFVDTEKLQLVPLREVERRTKCQKIGILFFFKNQLTKIFDPENDVGNPRLLGFYQMSIRHMIANGIHPIIFTEQQFNSFGQNEHAKVDSIRDRILSLSNEFHDNGWIKLAEEKCYEMNDK